jgi:hypothetical protein
LPGAAALDTILVVIMSLCLSLTLVLFVLVLIEGSFRTSAIRTMSRGIADVVLLIQAQLTDRKATFLRVLEEDLAKEGQGKSDTTVVSLALFQKAVEAALQRENDSASTWSPSPGAIQALFCVLKMVNGDDDVHSHVLSDTLRQSISGNDGVPLSMVRLAIHIATIACPQRSSGGVLLLLCCPSHEAHMSLPTVLDRLRCSFVLSWIHHLIAG